MRFSWDGFVHGGDVRQISSTTTGRLILWDCNYPEAAYNTPFTVLAL